MAARINHELSIATLPARAPVTMVIPTYNEADNLKRLIPVLMELPVDPLRVLIVDDNSPDGSGVIADEFHNRYPERVQVLHRAAKQGLGPAYLAGFEQVLKTDSWAVGQMDADFSHPPEVIARMIELIRSYDVVIGSRYTLGGSVDADWPLQRKLLSAFGNTYARTILGMKIKDVTGGFRLFRKTMLQRMPLNELQSTGYVFMVELIYCAHLAGAHIQETPIHFQERIFGRSKMSLKIQIEAALRVWHIRQRYLRLFAGEELPLPLSR